MEDHVDESGPGTGGLGPPEPDAEIELAAPDSRFEPPEPGWGIETAEPDEGLGLPGIELPEPDAGIGLPEPEGGIETAEPDDGLGLPEPDGGIELPEPDAGIGLAEPGGGFERAEPAREAGELAGTPLTGEPRVDAALARLDELPDLPVSEHREVFEHVHRSLTEVLGELDVSPPHRGDVTGNPGARGGAGWPG
jgi:hypothetical protein